MSKGASGADGSITTFLGMDVEHWAYAIALVALNIFVVWALRQVTLRITLTEVLAEKGPKEIAARAQAVEKALQRRAALNADDPAKRGGEPTDPGPIPEPMPTNYSRTSGFLGSLILVGALWAFANYAVWAAFWKPAALPDTLSALKSFFLAGSALFAPYAFNQLGSIFRQS